MVFGKWSLKVPKRSLNFCLQRVATRDSLMWGFKNSVFRISEYLLSYYSVYSAVAPWNIVALLFSLVCEPLLSGVSLIVCPSRSGGFKYFERGGAGRKTIYQPRPHLSQMHTTIYRPFTRKKGGFLVFFEPVEGAAAPTSPWICHCRRASYSGFAESVQIVLGYYNISRVDGRFFFLVI